MANFNPRRQSSGYAAAYTQQCDTTGGNANGERTSFAIEAVLLYDSGLHLSYQREDELHVLDHVVTGLVPRRRYLLTDVVRLQSLKQVLQYF